MPTTIKKISEQILILAKGGDYSAGSDVEEDDVKELVIQAINRQIKAETLNNQVISGEQIPNGCVMATYDPIAVVQYKNVAKITLPAIPVSLPKNIGLYHIGVTGLTETDPDTASATGTVSYPLVYVATGAETSFTDERLVGKTILLGFRETSNMKILLTGTPDLTQFLFNTLTGSVSWSTSLPATALEEFKLLYR